MRDEKPYAIKLEIKDALPAKFIQDANAILKDASTAEIIKKEETIIMVSMWEKDANDAIELLRKHIRIKFLISEPMILYKEENGKILEPVMKVTIISDEEHMGDAAGSINRRRGLITEMDRNAQDKVVIAGRISLALLSGYYDEIMQFTSGKGEISVELYKYEIAQNFDGPDPNEPVSMALRA